MDSYRQLVSSVINIWIQMDSYGFKCLNVVGLFYNFQKRKKCENQNSKKQRQYVVQASWKRVKNIFKNFNIVAISPWFRFKEPKWVISTIWYQLYFLDNIYSKIALNLNLNKIPQKRHHIRRSEIENYLLYKWQLWNENCEPWHETKKNKKIKNKVYQYS